MTANTVSKDTSVRDAYLHKRKIYWAAQEDFRREAIAEVRRLMPVGVERVILEINDYPRLTVVDMLDRFGESFLHGLTNDYTTFDDVQQEIDEIAQDMEAFDVSEAASFLSRVDNFQFYIERDEEGANDD